MAPPFFSVLIPFCNRRDMLLRALRSVAGQTERDYEIVLVDDGSQDGSLEAALAYLGTRQIAFSHVRLEGNRGIPAARNASLAAASGRIAAFLDSDDIWHPRFLSIVRSAYSGAGDPLFVFTDYFSQGPIFSGPVRQFQPPADRFDPIELMITKPFIHTMSCFTAPLKSVNSVGGFNERLTRFSDLDFYVRLLAGKGRVRKLAWHDKPFLQIPQIAVLKTIHLEDRSRKNYEAAWAEGRREFIALMFGYPFMRERHSLRAASERALSEAQEVFFRNFR